MKSKDSKKQMPRIHIGCICFFCSKTAGISAVVPLRMVMLFNTISQIFMCKALFFLVFRRNLRFNLIQAAVDLLLVFQNKVELFVQIIDDELAF